MSNSMREQHEECRLIIRQGDCNEQGLVTSDQQEVFGECLCAVSQRHPEDLPEVTAWQAKCDVQR